MKFRSLGLIAVLALSGCAVAEPTPSPTTSADASGDVVVFIGDSYTQGTGASMPDQSTAALLADDLGWTVQNLAQSATGYTKSVGLPAAPHTCGKNYCPSYTELLAFLPIHVDTIVVFGGRNQTGEVGADLINAIAGFYARLREAHPETRIIATNPLWDDSTPPYQITTMTKAVRDAALAVDAEYVNIGQPLEGHPELVTEDGIHPNDAGHALLAEDFAAAFRGETVATEVAVPAPTGDPTTPSPAP